MSLTTNNLIQFAALNKLEQVRYFLRTKSPEDDINARDEKHASGFTALLWACHRGNLEMAKLLIEKGDADVGVKDLSSMSVLHHACVEVKAADLVRYLIVDRGVEVNALSMSGSSALCEAANYGHLATVKILVQFGAKIDDPGFDSSPLMIASEHGHLDVVKYLVGKGAEIDAKSLVGRLSALHSAVKHNHTEVIAFLLEHDADIDLKGSEAGVTPLMEAAKLGHVESLEMLLEQGADADLESDSGATALMMAIQGGHLKAVRMLVEEAHVVITKEALAMTSGASDEMANYLHQDFKSIREYRKKRNKLKETLKRAEDIDKEIRNHQEEMQRSKAKLGRKSDELAALKAEYERLRKEYDEESRILALQVRCKTQRIAQLRANPDYKTAKDKVKLLKEMQSKQKLKKLIKNVLHSDNDGSGSDSERIKCKVCLQRKHNVVLMEPCKHHKICEECADKWLRGNKTCPICRAVVVGTTKLY